jgi:hypothetical protein
VFKFPEDVRIAVLSVDEVLVNSALRFEEKESTLFEMAEMELLRFADTDTRFEATVCTCVFKPDETLISAALRSLEKDARLTETALTL